MRKIIKTSFYVSFVLLLLLLFLSFSPLELVYLEHKIMYWQFCFYGFIITSLMSLYLMGSSDNIVSKATSISMKIIIFLIVGVMLYVEKPSQLWKNTTVLPILESSFFENVVRQHKIRRDFSIDEEKHRIVKRRVLHKYLTWCVEI